MRMSAEAKKQLLPQLEQMQSNVMNINVEKIRDLIEKVKKEASSVNLKNLEEWLKKANTEEVKVKFL